VLRSITVALGVSLTLALVACGNGGETASGDGGPTGSDCPDLSTQGGTFTVRIADFAFDPSCFRASAAQSIEVVNEDDATHTFTLQGTSIDVEISGGDTFRGEAVSEVVEPGTYTLVCRFHSNMRGEVTIVG
jgi:plastocyanin